MANSLKKAVVRMLGQGTGVQELHWGYLPLQGIVTRSGAGTHVELLDLAGRVMPIALDQIRFIAFVRDFNLNDDEDPERLSRRTFLARPRNEGLWLRLTLPGKEILEGLASIDLSLFDSLLADEGIYLIPPDIRSNTQRLFVPRSAIMDLQILGVILSPAKGKPVTPAKTVSAQTRLFPRSE